jgi:hypothetical protein
MAQRRSSGESRRGSSSSSRQHTQQGSSRQSHGARSQQGTLHVPRQSGSGATSAKRQQSAQDVTRAGESEMMARDESNKRRKDVMSDDDIERAGLTRESGLDEDETDSR